MTAKNKKYVSTLTALLFSFFIAGCATTGSYPNERKIIQTAHYSSAFPNKDVSKDLKKIYRSVKKIISTGIYHTYLFESELMTIEEIRSQNRPIKDLSTEMIVHDESSVGTAVSLDENESSFLFLTCAHVVELPDTLITYQNNLKDVPKNTFVKSITVNANQNNFIFENRDPTSFEVIRSDIDTDLSLIKVRKDDSFRLSAPPLNLTYGDPSDLDWGSFLYIFGYPKGIQMITRGIVSSPNLNRKHDFFTDALFNRGISGGLIIAIRGEVPNFEWVGVASSASATREVILTPNPKEIHQFQRFDFYPDTAFVDIKTRIDYGITQPIPLTKIRDFIQASSKELRKSGFQVKSMR